jgi:hypothetical protein
MPNRKNRYDTTDRKEYQRLYQRDYQKHRREATKEEIVKASSPDLTDRMFKFCIESLNKGTIELTPEAYRKLSTITDKNEWLTMWCDIFKVE